MTQVKLVLTGVKYFDKVLQNMEKGESVKVLKTATRLALMPVLRKTKADTPVRTGVLKKTIAIASDNNAKKGKFGAVVRMSVKRYTKHKIKEGYFYGPFVELGTSRNRGQNFMKNAAKSKRAVSQDILTRAIKHQITKASSDAGKEFKRSIRLL